MAKKNAGNIQILDFSKGVLININNYSSDLLLQQAAGMIILFSALAIGYGFSIPFFIMLVILSLIVLLLYGIVCNLKDQYMITIQDGSLEIIKGMYNSKILNISLKEIQNVYIKNIEGNTGIHMRHVYFQTLDSNELWIQTYSSKKYLVSVEMTYKAQVLVRDKILEHVSRQKE